MAGVLISGPAGGGKSQAARDERERLPHPAIVVDFQSIYAAITQAQRGPDGRYPERDEADLLPIVENIRQHTMIVAVERGINVVATNSDGSPERRGYLLGLLGPVAAERVIDPGRDVVTARLASLTTGELSGACESAIGRWYERLRP